MVKRRSCVFIAIPQQQTVMGCNANKMALTNKNLVLSSNYYCVDSVGFAEFGLALGSFIGHLLHA